MKAHNKESKRTKIRPSEALDIKESLLSIKRLEEEKASLQEKIERVEKYVKEILNLCQEINEISWKLGIGDYVDGVFKISTKPKTVLEYYGKEVLSGFRAVKDNELHVFVERADSKLISDSLVRKIRAIRNRLKREYALKQKEALKLEKMLQEERVVKDRKKTEKKLKEDIRQLRIKAGRLGIPL
ncbi:hypothetical protein M1293_00425 [Candidatus Parvarchaeota archaeon]|nr:hypothetical protein [Candidatus Parvarchaeota archaeon]